MMKCLGLTVSIPESVIEAKPADSLLFDGLGILSILRLVTQVYSATREKNIDSIKSSNAR